MKETTKYEQELNKLKVTYETAIKDDLPGINEIKNAIAGASSSSIVGVGSGGSFTVASLLCNLHEAYTGRVSRPSTPLELICNPNLASASPVFLISAEGKNPDILEALLRARRHSSRSVHIISNRKESPLLTLANTLTDVTSHIFPAEEKDGYLATNSLLLDAVLVARAYSDLGRENKNFPSTIENLNLEECTIDGWLQEHEKIIENIATRKSVIIVYSPLLKAVAADLESKLSESALLHCQVADLRSFAHGRHLWLSEKSEECSILAIVEPNLKKLWREMEGLLPKTIPVLTMSLSGSSPNDLIAGLIAQMKFIGLIAKHFDRDIAKPTVEDFGRKLYYLDLPSVIPPPTEVERHRELSKFEVLGAQWPYITNNGVVKRALESFENSFKDKYFKAIVFDYDGTLCNSSRKDKPPEDNIIKELIKLLEANITVGIASGRGDSIQAHLQNTIPTELQNRVFMGLYNGGWIGRLPSKLEISSEANEFLSHVKRIVTRLQESGAPIINIKASFPYQVSVRFSDGVNAERMWFVIADALRQAGLEASTIVCSKHSVDVLGKNVSKSYLVAHLIQELHIDPYDILTMGDQGAWPGNDSSLLEHRFSLSVDVPSRLLERGWKLAPAHRRDVDATLWYLENASITSSGLFKMNLSK